MKSAKLGKSISTIDINLTQFGMWLFMSDEEFFLSYEDYPFFKTAKVNDIYNVELHHKNHLYWPTLDIDLSIKILRNPHHFPLLAN